MYITISFSSFDSPRTTCGIAMRCSVETKSLFFHATNEGALIKEFNPIAQDRVARNAERSKRRMVRERDVCIDSIRNINKDIFGVHPTKLQKIRSMDDVLRDAAPSSNSSQLNSVSTE